MVKTRSSAPLPPPRKPASKQSKRTQKKPLKENLTKMTISRQALRSTVLSKISKLPKGKGYRRATPLDFTTNRGFSNSATVQKFNCPICLQIMIIPALSECGHAFCLPCIEQSLKHKHACSLCREPLSFQQFKRSNLIELILLRVIAAALDEKEFSEYHQRRDAFLEQDEGQRIPADITVGQLVDFYMEEQWHEGTIIKKEENQEDQTVLTLQSNQHQDITRDLKLDSRLLAKHHTYTKEKLQFQSFMGQLRLITNSIILGRGTSEIELYPITLHPHELGGDVMRIIFTFAPAEES